ncbi:MAG: nucleotidyltransferase domain-containing protein [Bacteroidia bacterium]|nr:nucleotidyltransferase domain-containing protein [Bacteroidia bacterium]MBN8692417.1 nucleotidyltransferase domain-containing protein [Bacteroidota bacterium]
MGILESNIDLIRDLCSKYNVSKLFVFGSVLTPGFSKKSDVDFIVSFNNVSLYDYADNYFNLKSSLEKILQRPVDLLEDKAINNPFLRESIDSSKQIVYGHRD